MWNRGVSDDDVSDDFTFPFKNIEKTLFELASSQRLLILYTLRDSGKKTNSLSKLAKDLNIVVQEMHRNLNRLSQAGLIKKDSEGNFSLTTFGNTVIKQLGQRRYHQGWNKAAKLSYTVQCSSAQEKA